CAIRRLDVDLHPIIGELELRDVGSLTHFGAILARMIKQQFIELRARHLIRAIALRPKAVLEIKLYAFRSAGRGDLAAELRHECRIEFFANAETIESSNAEWQ